MPRLTDDELEVLRTLVKLEDADPDGAWAAYFPAVAQSGGGRAAGILTNLRRRKLVAGEGRGVHATYYPTEAGRQAVKDASS